MKMPCSKHSLGDLGTKEIHAIQISHSAAHSGQAGCVLLHRDGRCHSDYEEMMWGYQSNKSMQNRND